MGRRRPMRNVAIALIVFGGFIHLLSYSMVRRYAGAATWIETCDRQKNWRRIAGVVVVIAHDSVLRAHTWGHFLVTLVLTFNFLRT